MLASGLSALLLFGRHQKGTIPMGREEHANMSFLRRLLHDKTANTLMISAAALIPILATVGGSIDASRYYMAASRLQAACDAGALAARRAMVGYNLTTADRTIGINFFDQNFNEGIFGTENGTRDFTANADGAVTGTATAELPTTIMAAFGYDDFDLEVTCTAEINMGNSDIMFVMNTFGARNGNTLNIGDPLRLAMLNFFDTVEAATSDADQVRFGLIPYGAQVNVGFSIPREYMANKHTYQSRVPQFEFQQYYWGGSLISIPRNPDDLYFLAPNNRQRLWPDSFYFRAIPNGNFEPLPDAAERELCESTLISAPYTIGDWVYTVSDTTYIPNRWPTNRRGRYAGQTGGCTGRVIITRRDPYDGFVEFKNYRYCPVETGEDRPCGVDNPADSPAGWEAVDLSSLYANNTISLPTGNLATGDTDFSPLWQTHTWLGCIEEPATVLTNDPQSRSIPAGAHDLNINLVPQNESQKWKPALPDAVFYRFDALGNPVMGPVDDLGNPGFPWVTSYFLNKPPSYCETAARKLEQIRRDDDTRPGFKREDLNAYLLSIRASLFSYDDVGMLWGARFLSPRGLFAAENDTMPNGEPIARHLVFVATKPPSMYWWDYTSHGVEMLDRRLSSDYTNYTNDGDPDSVDFFVNTLSASRRSARFQAICDATEQENITVWVVAFGTPLTQDLINCASPGRAFHAANPADIDARLQVIAQQMSALRITS